LVVSGTATRALPAIPASGPTAERPALGHAKRN
jgi:hypothetical protein